MKKVDYCSFSTRFSFLALMIFMALVSPMQAQEEQDESVQAQEEVVQESDDSAAIAAGEALFKSNCAACHKMDSRGIGPAMRGAGQKFEREWLYKWIRNSQELIRSGDKLANDLFQEWNGAVMTPFPGLSDEDIDNILAYVDQPKKEVVSPVAEGLAGASAEDSGISSNVILVVLAVLFLMLVVMLYAVNKTLVRFAKENDVPLHEGPAKPKAIWKAFAENQFLMIVFAIVLFFGGMYFAYGYLMQIGVDQGYQPVQPIHFSHKIHAGDNQIDCQFCHSSARSSKTSGIPSLNVCMNCHMNIDEYNGEVDIANGYTKEFYDNEIQKLYDAIGWSPEEQAYTGEEKPVKWVRVHNLPDFAYFNHAQHVSAGGLDCQQCHGPVEEMEILTQHSPLTMGWCIECHRTTNVAMEGNEYYEKIHEELSKKYGVERLTVAQMGGLECGKCHY
ncbi:MAG TPA: c-type cytochrome [Flavobacteriaceae bacterium]|nr:c-type cytochrome [Flavobacteriaceae bacterium]